MQAKIWPNHKTDYRPLLRFEKGDDLHFAATNIPHSKYYESMWYLLQLNADLNIKTIEVVEQEDISRFDDKLLGNADFFTVLDEDMCKVH